MNHNPPDSRPLDDIDVRLEEKEAAEVTDPRIEVATFTEGEYVESILISRARAAEIYRDLRRILGSDPATERQVPVCPRCGSGSVVADAAARWDSEGQIWEVSNVYDKGHGCDDCGAEDIAFDWITEKEHIERAPAQTARGAETP